MPIKRLDNTTINQIAAGEVIERPASVIRELLDNAIDAQATRIDITVADGGKTFIKVVDNGTGMNKQDLALAVERHCTSKLNGGLHRISTLGFRGEALPSIGSVSRLTVSSRPADSPEGWSIIVEGGKASKLKPAALNQGSAIEVANLFYATPARLKFLKTERSESGAIVDCLRRIALAHPHIHFTLRASNRQDIDYPATSGKDNLLRRISQVLGSEFAKNAMEIDTEREGVRLTGYAALPTFNRGNALHQFFYVNGRNVRDKQLLGATRASYMDSLARHRHPVLVLFIAIDTEKVDVNVHPAKSEVRFYQASLIQGLIVRTLKNSIQQNSRQVSTQGSSEMIASFGKTTNSFSEPVTGFNDPPSSELVPPEFSIIEPSGAVHIPPASTSDDAIGKPLGAARAQLHENYIIAQTQDGMVIVDAHAAHERLVYERIKEQWEKEGVVGQILLIPDIVELASDEIACLVEHLESLNRLGLELEEFGQNSMIVRATPSLLGHVDCAALLKDLADEIAQWGQSSLMSDKIHYVAATMACYGSVRTGRRLQGKK